MFLPVFKSKQPSWHGQWSTPSSMRGTTAQDKCVHAWL
jgi:hypothetical protein